MTLTHGNDTLGKAAELQGEMRKILAERRRQLDTFEAYIDSWTDAMDPETGEDPRQFARVHVVELALEQIKDATSTHDGGTSGSNVRVAKRRALELLASAAR